MKFIGSQWIAVQGRHSSPSASHHLRDAMDKGFHVLTDEYLEAVESPENRIRGKSRVKIFVGMEEPICWHHLWGYDINRLFTEPDFYYSEALRQRLWRFKHFSDDSKLD